MKEISDESKVNHKWSIWSYHCLDIILLIPWSPRPCCVYSSWNSLATFLKFTAKPILRGREYLGNIGNKNTNSKMLIYC